MHLGRFFKHFAINVCEISHKTKFYALKMHLFTTLATLTFVDGDVVIR